MKYTTQAQMSLSGPAPRRCQHFKIASKFWGYPRVNLDDCICGRVDKKRETQTDFLCSARNKDDFKGIH